MSVYQALSHPQAGDPGTEAYVFSSDLVGKRDAFPRNRGRPRECRGGLTGSPAGGPTCGGKAASRASHPDGEVSEARDSLSRDPGQRTGTSCAPAPRRGWPAAGPAESECLWGGRPPQRLSDPNRSFPSDINQNLACAPVSWLLEQAAVPTRSST